MAKEEMLETSGVITSAYRNGFLVRLDPHDHQVHCTLSGRLRTNMIKVVPGDKVLVKLSVYDTNKGIISRRVDK